MICTVCKQLCQCTRAISDESSTTDMGNVSKVIDDIIKVAAQEHEEFLKRKYSNKLRVEPKCEGAVNGLVVPNSEPFMDDCGQYEVDVKRSVNTGAQEIETNTDNLQTASSTSTTEETNEVSHDASGFAVQFLKFINGKKVSRRRSQKKSVEDKLRKEHSKKLMVCNVVRPPKHDASLMELDKQIHEQAMLIQKDWENSDAVMQINQATHILNPDQKLALKKVRKRKVGDMSIITAPGETNSALEQMPILSKPEEMMKPRDDKMPSLNPQNVQLLNSVRPYLKQLQLQIAQSPEQLYYVQEQFEVQKIQNHQNLLNGQMQISEKRPSDVASFASVPQTSLVQAQERNGTSSQSMVNSHQKHEAAYPKNDSLQTDDAVRKFYEQSSDNIPQIHITENEQGVRIENIIYVPSLHGKLQRQTKDNCDEIYNVQNLLSSQTNANKNVNISQINSAKSSRESKILQLLQRQDFLTRPPYNVHIKDMNLYQIGEQPLNVQQVPPPSQKLTMAQNSPSCTETSPQNTYDHQRFSQNHLSPSNGSQYTPGQLNMPGMHTMRGPSMVNVQPVPNVPQHVTNSASYKMQNMVNIQGTAMGNVHSANGTDSPHNDVRSSHLQHSSQHAVVDVQPRLNFPAGTSQNWVHPDFQRNLKNSHSPTKTNLQYGQTLSPNNQLLPNSQQYLRNPTSGGAQYHQKPLPNYPQNPQQKMHPKLNTPGQNLQHFQVNEMVGDRQVQQIGNSSITSPSTGHEQNFQGTYPLSSTKMNAEGQNDQNYKQVSNETEKSTNDTSWNKYFTINPCNTVNFNNSGRFYPMSMTPIKLDNGRNLLDISESPKKISNDDHAENVNGHETLSRPDKCKVLQDMCYDPEYHLLKELNETYSRKDQSVADAGVLQKGSVENRHVKSNGLYSPGMKSRTMSANETEKENYNVFNKLDNALEEILKASSDSCKENACDEVYGEDGARYGNRNVSRDGKEHHKSGHRGSNLEDRVKCSKPITSLANMYSAYFKKNGEHKKMYNGDDAKRKYHQESGNVVKFKNEPELIDKPLDMTNAYKRTRDSQAEYDGNVSIRSVVTDTHLLANNNFLAGQKTGEECNVKYCDENRGDENGTRYPLGGIDDGHDSIDGELICDDVKGQNNVVCSNVKENNGRVQRELENDDKNVDEIDSRSTSDVPCEFGSSRSPVPDTWHSKLHGDRIFKDQEAWDVTDVKTNLGNVTTGEQTVGGTGKLRECKENGSGRVESVGAQISPDDRVKSDRLVERVLKSKLKIVRFDEKMLQSNKEEGVNFFSLNGENDTKHHIEENGNSIYNTTYGNVANKEKKVVKSKGKRRRKANRSRQPWYEKSALKYKKLKEKAAKALAQSNETSDKAIIPKKVYKSRRIPWYDKVALNQKKLKRRKAMLDEKMKLYTPHNVKVNVEDIFKHLAPNIKRRLITNLPVRNYPLIMDRRSCYYKNDEESQKVSVCLTFLVHFFPT